MSMPCAIAGDQSIGHAGFSPSPITATTTDVTVMGSPPLVAQDVIGIHVLGQSAHTGVVQQVSTTVMPAKGTKGVARMMDKGDCGALILGTGSTVMVGG